MVKIELLIVNSRVRNVNVMILTILCPTVLQSYKQMKFLPTYEPQALFHDSTKNFHLVLKLQYLLSFVLQFYEKMKSISDICSFFDAPS